MPAQSIQSEGRARIISNDGSSGNACNLPQLKVAAFPFFPFRFFFFFFFCAQQAAMFCVLWTFFFSRFHYNTVLYTHLQANCAPFGWLPSTATIENIKNQASNWSHSHFHIPLPYPQPSPLPFNTPLPPAAVLHSRNAEVPLIQFD